MTTLDTVFELLSDERRRYALYYLEERNGPVSIDELVETVAAWESDPGADDPELDRIELELQHTHLPKTAAVDFVEYDPEERVVQITDAPPKFDVVTSVARIIERPAEE